MTTQPSIAGVSTSIAALIGRTAQGPVGTPTLVSSFADFERIFGGLDGTCPVSYQVWGFFQNGGGQALIVRLVGNGGASLRDADYLGDAANKTGLYAFEPNSFDILCIPPDSDGGDTSIEVYQQAAQLCAENHAMLIIDPPVAWQQKFEQGHVDAISLVELGSYPVLSARASAVYFPRLMIADPSANGAPKTIVPSGFIAGIWASTDARVGVWKAPAGPETTLAGVLGLAATLDDGQTGLLETQGINALRYFPSMGFVVWGARTMRGADVLGDQCKYISVQRLSDYIEVSLTNGTRWATFEPNGPALWASLTVQVTTFMANLQTQGALAGASNSEAFFVQCDATTTTPADQAEGVVNLEVGFAPTLPAEFVVLTISQDSEQSQ
jgi:phage tail sheath protein FI